MRKSPEPQAPAATAAVEASGGSTAPAAEEPDDVLIASLLETVRRFLAREVDGRAIDVHGRIPRRVIEQAGHAGLFGLTIPEAYGGTGLSLGTASRVIEELAVTDRSVAIMIGLHAGLGTRGIVELGTPALRAAWLPRLATGACVASFAATEAGAGSDLTSVRTIARLMPDGGLELQGEKSYVTNGGFAGVFTVLARTPELGGARAQSLLVVPSDAPGVEIGAEEDKLGIRGSSTVTVRFAGVRVARGDILGQPGRGADHAQSVLTWGRTLMSAGCVGTARAALEATLAYVTIRRQFGQPLGEFAASRAHVADMAARLYAMRSLVAWTGEVHAHGGAIEMLSAAAKVFCSEEAFGACDTALQLHGAVGFMEQVGIARMLRDCRITRIFEGANDVLLVRMGAARVGTRDRSLASERLACFGATRWPEAVEACEQLGARLDAAIAEVRRRHGVTAVRRQTVLQRLARADVVLHAAVAALARASAPTRTGGRHDERDLGADGELAAHAALALCATGLHHLESISGEASREARALSITDRLYAPHRVDSLAPVQKKATA